MEIRNNTTTPIARAYCAAHSALGKARIHYSVLPIPTSKAWDLNMELTQHYEHLCSIFNKKEKIMKTLDFKNLLCKNERHPPHIL